MPIDDLFGTTVQLLGKNLDLRARSHNQISANIANAETPGYTPSVLSFEKELRDAVGKRGKTIGTPALTHPGHIRLTGQAAGIDAVRGRVVEMPDATSGLDGNGVELENEMGRMMENQIMYNATLQFIGKKFEGLKAAMKGDR